MTTASLSHLLYEPTPAQFSFEATATAHGWAALQPFQWDASTATLRRVQQLSSGQVVTLHMQANDHAPNNAVRVQVESTQPLTPTEEAEIRRATRRMLRLDEELDEFYQLNAQMNGWQLRLKPGGGRLLRCPTLFEDMVYTLCTTNIAWSGTKRMVERLTNTLGQPLPFDDTRRAFPSPEAIAGAGPDVLKRETGLGYRSQYVWALARAVAEGQLDLSNFEEPHRPTDDLRQALLKIKGFGSYATATILMLLSRYEHLAIDSEMRAFVSKKYFDSQPVSDSQIEAIYAPWGRWKYLAYWFDAA